MPLGKDDKDDDIEKIRQNQQFEQNSSWIGDNLPPMWRRMFESCKLSGFDDDQSLKLVQTFIIAQGTGDKKAP